MVAAESRFAEDHSSIQWKQTDYPFPDIQISEEQESYSRELEEEKLSKLCDEAIKHRKSPVVAALIWKRRDRNELSNLYFSWFSIEDLFW